MKIFDPEIYGLLAQNILLNRSLGPGECYGVL
jgi:hypothetical protein